MIRWCHLWWIFSNLATDLNKINSRPEQTMEQSLSAFVWHTLQSQFYSYCDVSSRFLVTYFIRLKSVTYCTFVYLHDLILHILMFCLCLDFCLFVYRLEIITNHFIDPYPIKYVHTLYFLFVYFWEIICPPIIYHFIAAHPVKYLYIRTSLHL